MSLIFKPFPTSIWSKNSFSFLQKKSHILYNGKVRQVDDHRGLASKDVKGFAGHIETHTNSHKLVLMAFEKEVNLTFFEELVWATNTRVVGLARRCRRRFDPCSRSVSFSEEKLVLMFRTSLSVLTSRLRVWRLLPHHLQALLLGKTCLTGKCKVTMSQWLPSSCSCFGDSAA